MSDFSSRIDLHTHTTVSDGTDTPAQLLENVIAAGIEVFSVTDHDAVKSADVIRPLLDGKSPKFIPGVEFSCRDGLGKYHILGYGFDPDSVPILNVVGRGHSIRMKKVTARLDFLKYEFGFSFPEEEIEKLLLLDNPGKPHIANLMIKYGYADTKENAINNYLNLLKLTDSYIGPREAIEGILASGGIPVLAHPFYGSGDELILGDDMEDRLRRLKAFGLKGIEAFYSGFSEKLSKTALFFADKFDLFVTAGSDYHGKNKLVRLGDTGLGEKKEYPARLKKFLELF
ncbi:MAG: PHP domain-containing protein [Clostridia bacterium]|nr:PHP domain-containing protein [Clostridia bacterium]